VATGLGKPGADRDDRVGLEGDVGFSTYTHDSGVDCGHKNSCANGGSGMEDCGLRSIHEGGIIRKLLNCPELDIDIPGLLE